MRAALCFPGVSESATEPTPPSSMMPPFRGRPGCAVRAERGGELRMLKRGVDMKAHGHRWERGGLFSRGGVWRWLWICRHPGCPATREADATDPAEVAAWLQPA
jgi:hypothetical protein